MKADPEDLKDIADELAEIQNDYRDILNMEPRLKQPIDDAERIARKRYQDVSEKGQKP